MKRNILLGIVRNNNFYLLLILIALAAVVSSFNPTFSSFENLSDIFRSSSFLGVLAIGELVVLIFGGIDLSFTAVATISQYCMALLLKSYPQTNIAIALLLPLLVALALGLTNGFLIHFLDASPLIITISTLNIFYGLFQVVSRGKWIDVFPSWFVKLSRTSVLSVEGANHSFFNLSVLAVTWIALVLITFLLLRYMKVGRKIFAMGGNFEAARRSGIDLLRMRLFVYGFMGAMAGFGGVIQAQLTLVAAPNSIFGRELDVIAAVVLGGASLFGGAGSLLGTVLGVLLIAVIGNGLMLMGLPSSWQRGFLGFVIICSVFITAQRAKAAQRRTGRLNESK